MAFISAVPKLASMDIQRSIAFYEKLGFAESAYYPDYGIVEQDGVQIHFWLCTDPAVPKATGCRINVSGVDELFATYSKLGVIHPNDPLTLKPWGLREFSILDVDGNLVTFAE
jgi:catechol 2,3-dioxygenase-like lactoylglutathione lyase family enzyme